ncbi:MAG: hypothetical protein LBS74_11520 [Oscillospiraceae bacterium]|nr:hypothetical protein [Oscillospiraceae bacterium]
MKKVITRRSVVVLVLAVACVFTAILIYVNRPMYLVTGKVDDVSKITRVKDACDSSKKTTIDLSLSAAKDVFKELRRARTTAVKHPRHFESMQSGSKYIIIVHYNNSESERIETTENPWSWYRFINTEGSSGDLGICYKQQKQKAACFNRGLL